MSDWLFCLFSHNIQILERDYSVLNHIGLEFGDIEVDAQMGIVIQNFQELQEPKASEAVVVKLASLSAKYSYCWLLFYRASKGKR